MKSFKFIFILFFFLYQSIDAYSKGIRLSPDFISRSTLFYATSSGNSYLYIVRDVHDEYSFRASYKFAVYNDEGYFNAVSNMIDLTAEKEGSNIKSILVCLTYEDTKIRISFIDDDGFITIRYIENTNANKSYDMSFSTSPASVGFSEKSGEYNMDLITTPYISKTMEYIYQFFSEIKYPNRSYELSNYRDWREHYDTSVLNRCLISDLILSKPDISSSGEKCGKLTLNANSAYFEAALIPNNKKMDEVLRTTFFPIDTYVQRTDDRISMEDLSSAANRKLEISVDRDKTNKKIYQICLFEGSEKYEYVAVNVEYSDKDYEPKERFSENMYGMKYTVLDFIESILKRLKFSINYK